MKLKTADIIKVLILSMSSFFATSCGKKNTINSSQLNSTISPFYAGNPAMSPAIVSQVQSIRSTVACLPGKNRLATDVSFYINGGVMTGTTISGNWIPGFLTSGTISNLFVGVSSFHDLLFITKVTNGAQVVGYNATLSFCEIAPSNTYAPPYSSQYPTTYNATGVQPLLVANDRILANFQTPNGIVLGVDTYCGYGVIDAAINTSIVSQRNANPLTNDFPFITSFSKPMCNGKF